MSTERDGIGDEDVVELPRASRRGVPIGMHLDPTLTLGALFQIGLMLLGLIIWIINYAGKTDDTARELGDFKATVAAQFSQASADTAKQFDDIRRRLDLMADFGARINNNEARLNRLEQSQAEAVRALIRAQSQQQQGAAHP